MKFGCSLGIVNLRYCEPNRSQRDARYYWEELFQLVSAAGFKGIELPYDPQWQFGGRSGIPLYSDGVKYKYGSVKGFADFLHSVGIETITGLHLNTGFLNSMAEEVYFGGFMHFAAEMIEYAAEIGALSVIISPSPELGELLNNMSKGKGTWDSWVKSFIDKTIENINKLGEQSQKSGVKLSIKNEFWSLAHGNRVEDFLKELDPNYVSYCADVAHIAIAKADPVAAIKKYKDRLGCVHMSDTAFEDVEENFKKYNPEYPQAGNQHVFSDMGQGNLDLSGIYNALKDIGYQGWVICDSNHTTDISRALLRMRYQLGNVILK